MKTVYALIGLAGLVVFFKFMDRLSFWKTEFPILNDIPTGWLFIILLLVFIVLITLLNSDSNNNQ
ncbi:MAG: hypothetical protein OSA10_10670 [Paracoccaceae bacterium]|nr:hypothetical protein [Paracoccaceae bacterium]